MAQALVEYLKVHDWTLQPEVGWRLFENTSSLGIQVVYLFIQSFHQRLLTNQCTTG